MERDNFYILLELNLEPPETDDAAIYETIQKKKAEWSRLRNHPTKGIQAQKFISMIPEIQRVMMSQEDRHKEALAAIELVKKGKLGKYAEIDRHIDILMGKGYLLDEEIAKLADIHGIELEDIKPRVAAKREEQYRKIDQAIHLRMEKGYLTEAEIIKLAGRYGFKPEAVRSRVRCPIVKDEKEKIAKPALLDKSIEKAIIENLKVIHKFSLYDFLNLPETAELSLLQEKASQKKKELASFSRKDADNTAGSILAGQCLTIFKNNENRMAYDISLAKAKLASLHSDIDIAAIGGLIRFEYFNILASKTMDFGMDREEAEDYITRYCRQKSYRIEKMPDRKRSLMFAGIAAGTVALLILIGGISFHIINTKKSDEAAYRHLLATVENQPLEKKIALLRNYADAHQKSERAKDAAERITRIEEQITARELENVRNQADQFIRNNDLEQARVIYQKFLASRKYPGARQQVESQIQDISKQIDIRDYERITQIMAVGEPDEKIAALERYLDDHPNGVHLAAVNRHIQDMSAEYFIFIQKQLDVCEKQEDWPSCIALCRNFIKLYDNIHADQLKARVPQYEEQERYDKIFKALVNKANQLDNNYDAAREVFTDFIAAYPRTPITKSVHNKIDEIDEMIAVRAEAEKMSALRTLLKKSGRFTEGGEGVVVDSKTRLMWSLLDARGMMPSEDCIDYEKAKNHVKTLSIGGYRDWRVPTINELKGIYKSAPVFPLAGANEWYWTSEHFTSYADGWQQIKVNTLARETDAEWLSTHRDSRECGNVRAVRSP